MPRPKTIPRHEGEILLHNEQTLSKLNIPRGTDVAGYKAVMKVLKEQLRTVCNYFEIETGKELHVAADEKAGFTWCIEDNTLNSSQYRWLETKGRKMEKAVVRRMNQHGIKNALSS